jgi:hypothetical protein
MEYAPNVRSEEEYFRTLRNRIIECICREILHKKRTTFHGIDMIEDCVRGFYDKSEADKYQFSEESTDYKHFYWLSVDSSINTKIITSKYLGI